MDANHHEDFEMNCPPWWLAHRITLLAIAPLVLSTACAHKPEIDSFTIMTATPSQVTNLGPTSTPEPQVPYVISGIPHCPGLQDLGVTLAFEWPNIETALEKLKDYNWGYYTCSLSQPELKSFMHEKMVLPPYLWQEVTWVDNGPSTGALYFHSVFRAWIYLWMVPQPSNKDSYLVIAKGDPGAPQTWDCRLLVPETLARVSCPVARRSAN
jgi:hypothetical protein